MQEKRPRLQSTSEKENLTSITEVEFSEHNSYSKIITESYQSANVPYLSKGKKSQPNSINTSTTSHHTYELNSNQNILNTD